MQIVLRSVTVGAFPCIAGSIVVALLAGEVQTEERIHVKESPDSTAEQVDYVRDIRPIFRKSCYSCHGPEEAESGLRLDIKRRALAGGDQGRVIIPGNSADSRIVQLVAGTDPDGNRMPPEGEGTPLTDEQVELLRKWIDQGSPWPDEADADGMDHGRDGRLWAFEPIKAPELPRTTSSEWVRNAIDTFILSRLEREGVEPSPPAERAVLIRRVYLDLIGLPPNPSEWKTWVDDPRADWYERLVERLLASPHYGERWGRHWLDIARYADSDGFEQDRGRPHAWRWRDWVIQAINEDIPFDQFTIEQLAGDLLPEATFDQQIATGFHRNTLLNREGGIDKEEDRVKRTVDRTNTIGEAWLGMTVKCAHCHTHKYDPLSQSEYFGLYAFFNSLEEPDSPAPNSEQLKQYEKAKRAFDREHQEYLDTIQQYESTELTRAQIAWEGVCLNPSQTLLQNSESQESASPDSIPDNIPDNIVKILNVRRDDRDADQTQQLAEYYRSIDPGLNQLKRRAEEHAQEKEPSHPGKSVHVQVVAERDELRPTLIHIRGDFLNKGYQVQRNTPAALHPLKSRGDLPDRLDLAHWLIDPDNPLTARVRVNQVWKHYFGRGIVATINDFGTQGERPSHPQLLDWLATQFRKRGWSTKALHRVIVHSATYRQSSRARPALVQSDPYNTWLARQNRMRVDAEVVRDLALSVAGLLVHRVGGPSVRPALPGGVIELSYASTHSWNTSRGANRFRRGLYTFFQRTVPYPMLMTFDAPDSFTTCISRERSNTPLQALTLWNDPVFFECAQSLGRRLVDEVPDHGNPRETMNHRIRYAFDICLAREPSETEMDIVRDLYDAQLALAQKNQSSLDKFVGELPRNNQVSKMELAAWIHVGRLQLNMDEFITRQ